MKKFCFLCASVLLFLMIFVSCSKKDITHYKYVYTGANDLWSAKYTVNETVTFTDNDGKLDVETEAQNELVLTYQGDLADLAPVKHMEISYDSTTEGGTRVEEFSDGESISTKVFTLTSGGKNGALHSKDDIITVTINLDGDIQTFELKNQ